MGRIILSANLGNFDDPVDPVEQTVRCDFHRFTDKDFPPITGLTPRLQYRIPKTHGWQMKPGRGIYMWLDGSFSLQRLDSLEWFMKQLGYCDMAFFPHPDRSTIREEVDYIEKKLNEGNRYIASRYQNGLHREQLEEIMNTGYEDNILYHSGVFIYRNTERVQAMLKDWWYEGTRYFTCDQVALPYLMRKHGLIVRILSGPIYQNDYVSLVSHHK